MLWSALYRVRTSLSKTQNDAIEAAFTSRIQVLSGTASGIDACHSSHCSHHLDGGNVKYRFLQQRVKRLMTPGFDPNV